ALNRLIARQYPATPALNVQYHYDMTANGNKGVGRLTAVQDASGVLGYQYDERGNLIQQLRSVPVLGSDQYDTLGYAYDAANHFVRIDYPAGFSIHYTRNAAGQVSQVGFAVGSATPTPLASQIAYAPFGPLKSLTWNNGIVLNRTYDQDYQLTAQQVGTWQSQYSHDANGNITAHAHSLFGSINYRYDALDRLTMEEAGLRKTYTYDANGNRTSRTTAHTSLGITYFQHRLRYAPDSNRLLQSDSLYEAEVDAAGNYTRHTLSKRYQYDDQGRLSNVIDQRGNGVARYTYNALGQRVLKEARQGTNRLPFTYLYGPNGQVLGQVSYTAQGRKSKASYYVWLDDLPIAQIDLAYNFAGTVVDSTTLTYLHSDHLNTPRLATNQGGNLVWSWPSDAFGIGQPKTHGSTIDVILRFPGQVADAHSGLYYNYFRDYDPQTGRYVESDPIGLRGGLNTYGYVYANPLKLVDPYGLAVGFDDSPGSAALEKAYDEVRKTKHGEEICRKLEEDPNYYLITSKDSHNSAWYEGKTRTIRIDPNFNPMTNTTQGDQPASTTTIMAHEVGHAATKTWDDGAGQMNNVNANENPVRRELGLPERTSYEYKSCGC
ncbi:RHS repeat-associated core domain-containing protein, partial [Metapseudomonas otitidis]|uniref:RHS repeat-associated core domain-containing protein n=2 Tax=Pseudomonadaceae TaxID=135621 RepID=UPI0023F9ED70